MKKSILIAASIFACISTTFISCASTKTDSADAKEEQRQKDIAEAIKQETLPVGNVNAIPSDYQQILVDGGTIEQIAYKHR